MSRCLYNSDLATFLYTDSASIYRILDDNYHGEALTTTRDAWKAEIDIMKNVVSSLNNVDGQIIFEYDIPRLGKRIDVVLLYRGVVFCLEFKVGESKILETNIDQVLDYALDLKNFHKFSEDKVIAPILVATNYSNRSTSIQMSVYDDRVINPLVTGKAGISAPVRLGRLHLSGGAKAGRQAALRLRLPASRQPRGDKGDSRKEDLPVGKVR